MPNHVRLLLPLALLAACARTGIASGAGPEDVGVLPDAGNDTTDVASDVDAVDAAMDVPADDVLRPAPEIVTPRRSAAVDRLYCGLSNGQLVQGALRAAACLDVSVAGVLDDAARGFVYGEVVRSGYGAWTWGNCDVLRCLNNATSCEEARACEDARVGATCEGFGARCDGDTLEVCGWDGAESRWTRVQDCTRQGARCVAEGEAAWCEGDVRSEVCGYYGACDGNALVRCNSGQPFGEDGSAVRIPCDELVADGVCIETPVGGEAPGPACSSPDQECTNSFAEGFGCDAAGNLTICLYGSLVVLNCAGFGYAGCDEGTFFGARCVE